MCLQSDAPQQQLNVCLLTAYPPTTPTAVDPGLSLLVSGVRACVRACVLVIPAPSWLLLTPHCYITYDNGRKSHTQHSRLRLTCGSKADLLTSTRVTSALVSRALCCVRVWSSDPL